MPTSRSMVVVIACVVFGMVGTGLAAPLADDLAAYDDGNGPTGGQWRGSVAMVDTDLAGIVEYAVYAPGAFPYAGLDGWTPTPGEMVYAYQIFSTGTAAIEAFQVILGNVADNEGSADLGNGGDPIASSLLLPNFFVNWTVDGGDPGLETGENSVGLVYSSIKKPVMSLGSVINSTSASGLVPGPGSADIPEPATMCLLALGAVGLLRRRRRTT